MVNNYPTKNFASTFIYSKGDYERPLMNAIMTCNRIDKTSKEFESIIYDIKRRQETVAIVDVLMSDNVVLMMNAKALPDAFSVFSAKDIKEGTKGQMKVFIDCTNIMTYKNGFYNCTRIDILIAYLISAMNQIIYYADTKRIVTNNALCTSCTDCYVSAFMYILDYLRLSGVEQQKEKLYYIIAMYFQTSVLCKPVSESTRATAMKIAKINNKEANLVDILYDPERDFVNINTFINRLNDVFKFKGLTVDVFVERWRYLFGRGTQFAPELYPSFATMITNAYSGSYLNQQKTIEKCMAKSMVTFTTTLLTIGHTIFHEN